MLFRSRAPLPKRFALRGLLFPPLPLRLPVWCTHTLRRKHPNATGENGGGGDEISNAASRGACVTAAHVEHNSPLAAAARFADGERVPIGTGHDRAKRGTTPNR